ncbi:MAG: hypothetical protein JXR95_11565 [Deltaproteobacteria bacterium]|nr:hypothetical protein [Deltaproteobacteria bacterium]
MYRTLITLFFGLALFFSYQGNLFAQGGMTDEEIRVNTLKYMKALKEKGKNVHVFNAGRIIKYLKTHPKAARGMYMGYKGTWDKILGWEDTPSMKHLKELQAKLASVSRLSLPSETSAFKKYELQWRRLEGDASYHIKTYCTGKTDKTCAAALSIQKGAVSMVVKAWNHGMNTPGVEFDALQDVVIGGEREKLYSSHVKLDKWVPQLAKEKTIYWKNFLTKKGGLKKFAKSEDEVKCVPVKKTSGSRLNNSLLKFLFNHKDKVTIRCEFLKAPKKWKKYAKKPYWKVSLMWYGRWETIRTYEISRPYGNSLAHWKWNASDLGNAIRKKASATKFTYPGKWARVQVEYIYPWIEKYIWVRGVKVPKWKYSSKAGTSFFLKWR